MALPAPDETLLGVTQYRPRKKQAPIVPIRVERREPPRVLNKPGTTEWVGTQKPTEQQKPEKTTLTAVRAADFHFADPNTTPEAKAKEAEALKALQAKNGGKLNLTDVALYRLLEFKKAENAYNISVKRYNQAIGYKTPEQNKAIAARLLKKTQPKTVMS